MLHCRLLLQVAPPPLPPPPLPLAAPAPTIEVRRNQVYVNGRPAGRLSYMMQWQPMSMSAKCYLHDDCTITGEVGKVTNKVRHPPTGIARRKFVCVSVNCIESRSTITSRRA